MNEKRELVETVERLADVLDRLGIGYAIGGALASSTYGAVRFTMDADITVQPFSSVADKLFDLLKDEFYISERAMRQALACSRSFNIIHYETGFKIDMFIQSPSEFEQRLLLRSKRLRLDDASPKKLPLVSPEDIVLLKLRWFKETDCTSDRQWRDVLGVLAVQGESLDFDYLTDSARELGLEELLDRARAEVDT